MEITRSWSMANSNTFDIPCVGNLVNKYLQISNTSIDPFARNKEWATFTNDLNENTKAMWHMDALDFLNLMVEMGIKADLVIFDPPYSPRQIKECYEGVGLKMQQKDAWRTNGWSKEKDIINSMLLPGGVFLYFGWNTCGMGEKRGFSIEKIQIVCHGPGHNDLLCTVERKVEGL